MQKVEAINSKQHDSYLLLCRKERIFFFEFSNNITSPVFDKLSMI